MSCNEFNISYTLLIPKPSKALTTKEDAIAVVALPCAISEAYETFSLSDLLLICAGILTSFVEGLVILT